MSGNLVPVTPMTRAQMALLLTKLSSYDGRDVHDAAVAAWLECIGNLPFQECMDYVPTWYRRNTRRMMPADFVELVEGPADGSAFWTDFWPAAPTH